MPTDCRKKGHLYLYLVQSSFSFVISINITEKHIVADIKHFAKLQTKNCKYGMCTNNVSLFAAWFIVCCHCPQAVLRITFFKHGSVCTLHLSLPFHKIVQLGDQRMSGFQKSTGDGEDKIGVQPKAGEPMEILIIIRDIRHARGGGVSHRRVRPTENM